MWQINSVKVNNEKKKNEDVMGGFRGERHCTLKPQNGKLKPKEKNHL